jgi:hypothetical protein
MGNLTRERQATPVSVIRRQPPRFKIIKFRIAVSAATPASVTWMQRLRMQKDTDL